MDKLSYLARINVLQELPRSVLMEIDRRAPMVTATKGSLIMHPGDPRPVLYLLKQGRVRLYKLNAEGKQFTSAILGQGNIFGEIGAFSTGTRDVYAEAMEDCLVCALSRADVEHLLLEHPRLALRILEVTSSRLREAEDLMGQLALGDIRSRLLFLLLKLSMSFGKREGEWIRVQADLTHQELANMIGATRESVSATLAALNREGVVRTGRKELWVHRERAEALLNSES